MKKKILALVCMITCIFGLTACGNGEVLTEFEQQKVSTAEQMASQAIIPLFVDYLCNEEVSKNVFLGADMSEFTAEEVSYLCEQTFGVKADGYVMRTAVESFRSGLETIGGIAEVGTAKAELHDKQIIVEVEIKGVVKNATAEIIFSNDMFLELESASLNPGATMGEMMGKAALNTLIGMGTVFIVLILISLIISCFGVIPKLLASAAERRAAKTATEKTGDDNTVEQAAVEEYEDEADEQELVAVIAAAVAAYEGAASTDGFVVRSIRRR